MNEIITPDEFVEALAEATRTMTEEVVEEMENGLVDIANNAVEELKQLSPVYKGSSKKLKKGDKYLITSSREGFETLSSGWIKVK